MAIRFLLASVFQVILIGSLNADGPKPDENVQLEKDRKQSQNNLKMIGLAFHNYAATNKSWFPNNIEDSKGKLLISWRVLLLPYLEEEKLFKEFKLDEAWDSEHNKKLISKIPKVFAPVRGKAEKGETYYRGFTGKNAIFEAGGNLRFPGAIPDGSSRTLLCVEAEIPVPWTKPDDLPFNPKKDELPKVGGAMFKDGFNAAFCDGSVHFIKKDVDRDTLRYLIDRADGMVVNIP